MVSFWLGELRRLIHTVSMEQQWWGLQIHQAEWFLNTISHFARFRRCYRQPPWTAQPFIFTSIINAITSSFSMCHLLFLATHLCSLPIPVHHYHDSQVDYVPSTFAFSISCFPHRKPSNLIKEDSLKSYFRSIQQWGIYQWHEMVCCLQRLGIQWPRTSCL